MYLLGVHWFSITFGNMLPTAPLTMITFNKKLYFVTNYNLKLLTLLDNK